MLLYFNKCGSASKKYTFQVIFHQLGSLFPLMRSSVPVHSKQILHYFQQYFSYYNTMDQEGGLGLWCSTLLSTIIQVL
jgi:hypothetical protein